MSTEGKIPFLGFKAGAIKFLTLLGFSTRLAVQAAYPGVEFFEATDSPLLFEADSSPVFHTAV